MAGRGVMAVLAMTAAVLLAPVLLVESAGVAVSRTGHEMHENDKLVFQFRDGRRLEVDLVEKYAPLAVQSVVKSAHLHCYSTLLSVSDREWRVALAEGCVVDMEHSAPQVHDSLDSIAGIATAGGNDDMVFLDPSNGDIVVRLAAADTAPAWLLFIGLVARRPAEVGEDASVAEVQLVNRAWQSVAEALPSGRGRRMLREKACDDGILEYISGSKVNETIIPYPEKCLEKYNDMGHKLELPKTVGVHMTGLPKTGTTWTEVFVGKLLEGVCNSGMYKGCKFDLTYRGAMATIPSGRHHAGNVIRWNTFLKHDPPFDWTCKGFSTTRTSAKSGCHMYQFQIAERNIPDWEECIFTSTYRDIGACIPPYMQVLQDLPVLDKLAQDMQNKKKTEKCFLQINMDGAVRKYIHVIRDPRDAALSWIHYHGITKKSDIDKGVKSACNHYIAWTAFYHYWQMVRYGAVYPSMELFYRDLMDNASKEYTKVLAWFGLRASSETLKRVLKETDMGAMQRMEAQRLLPGRNHAGRADQKVRQGGYGNFNDELSADTIKKCTQAMKLMLPEKLLQMFGAIKAGEAWDPSTISNPLI